MTLTFFALGRAKKTGFCALYERRSTEVSEAEQQKESLILNRQELKNKVSEICRLQSGK